MFIFLGSNHVYGRVCFEKSIPEKYKNAQLVFSGAVKQGEHKKCTEKTATFKVNTVYKGVFTDEVILNVGRGCDNWLTEGKEYIFFIPSHHKIFDTSTGVPRSVMGFSQCVFGHLNNETETEKVQSFVKGITKQITLLDENIKTSVDKAAWHKTKAAYLLHWQDYARAAEELKKILAVDANNEWALFELIRSLYEQNKPKEIWDIYLSNENARKQSQSNRWKKTALYIDYAAFILTKQYEEQNFMNIKSRHKPNVNDVYIQYLPLINKTIEFKSIYNTNFDQINFSDSTFNGHFLNGARFTNSQFINTKFLNATFRSVQILYSDLSGADLSGIKIDHLSLTNTTYDCDTKWPEGFDPIKAGAKKMADACK